MRIIICIVSVILLLCIFCSCNCKKTVEDEYIMEDYFIVEILIPNDNAIRDIGKELSNHIPNFSMNNNDSLVIECEAIWNVSKNAEPSSIRIIEIDTNLFIISDSARILFDWDRQSDRSVLQTIKSILDTATYSLICDNHDEVTPQSIIDGYYDSIVKTMIYFAINL